MSAKNVSQLLIQQTKVTMTIFFDYNCCASQGQSIKHSYLQILPSLHDASRTDTKVGI
jgi:hypothetical protein